MSDGYDVFAGDRWGMLDKISDGLADASATKLLEDVELYLAEDDVATVLRNYEAGRASLSVGLRIKTSFLKQIP